MSRTKRTSTIKSTNDRARLTTWQDEFGVRHRALAKPAGARSPRLTDVFTPCVGYVEDALDNTELHHAVTCVYCLSSKFADVCSHMNLDAIEDLDEYQLLDHFEDRDAMALNYEHP